MAFVLQNGGLNALGDPGSNVGVPPCWDGIPCTFSTPSVAVSFRVYGGCANHVSLVIDDYNTGDPNSCGAATAAAPFSLYGSPVWVWIDYSAKHQLLQVYVSRTSSKPGNPVLMYNNLNLTSAIGPVAYAGFTGGTGGLYLNADVLSWQLAIPQP